MIQKSINTQRKRKMESNRGVKESCQMCWAFHGKRVLNGVQILKFWGMCILALVLVLVLL